MWIGQIPRPAVTIDDIERDTGRTIFAQMFFRQLQDLRPILIRHEPESYFRDRVTRQNRLRSLSLITAADAVYLGRWSRPNALHRSVTFFAKERGHTALLLDFAFNID